jgi:hypothetical protein
MSKVVAQSYSGCIKKIKIKLSSALSEEAASNEAMNIKRKGVLQ